MAEDSDYAVGGGDGAVDKAGFRTGCDKGGGCLELREYFVGIQVDRLFDWRESFGVEIFLVIWMYGLVWLGWE